MTDASAVPPAVESDPLLLLAVLALAPALTLIIVLSALLERSSPIRLRHWTAEAGGDLQRLYEAPSRFEAFRFLLTLLARWLPVVAAGLLWILTESGGFRGGWWLAPLTVGVLLAAIEWLNRPLVEHHAERALARLTGVFRLAYRLLKPAVWVLGKLVVPAAEPVNGNGDDDELSDGEIDAFIDVGRREGILEPDEEELVRSIVDFGDTQVRRVMTPRVEMRSAPESASLEEIAQVFFESKHARLPIYRESIDQVVGILHIRDLCEALQTGRSTSVAELSNPPYYVPETKPLREMLAELQALHQQMAIVVDEYGGVAGLVTVEDLVEEIVGEIQDEHEATAAHGVRIDDDSWRLQGRTDLEQLGELFERDFDVPYETVSGLICGELGYVPKAGETFESHGLTFSIEEADERRVTSVAVAPGPAPAAAEET
jgi:CBS domain containing-hemolysin-like protein